MQFRDLFLEATKDFFSFCAKFLALYQLVKALKSILSNNDYSSIKVKFIYEFLAWKVTSLLQIVRFLKYSSKEIRINFFVMVLLVKCEKFGDCVWIGDTVSKGQIISIWFFDVFDFLQKTNENKLIWGIIVVKSNSFVRFLEEIEDIKTPFEINWPLEGPCLVKWRYHN